MTDRKSEQCMTFDCKSWRDITPMNASVATMMHNLTGTWRFIRPVYEDKTPACQNACPAGNDIEAFIKLILRGNLKRAYWHLKREQPFPAILGRVCFRFCETACNRGGLDESIRINELERYVGDQVPLSTPFPDPPPYHGQTLAVAGSGPAGMSAAYFARLLGFKVTIFEAADVPGGILRTGIPAYRLPRSLVEQEFEGLKGLGIELVTGVEIGKDLTLEKLARDFDNIFLATGVHGSYRLGLDGEKACPQVMSGLDFLQRVAVGRRPALGKKVQVIGGGNTALDAARTALRLGSEVTVVYRRSETEMPAHPEEVADAREEGVRFHFLAAPQRLIFDGDGQLNGLACCDMELGDPDESGRRRPIKKEGPGFELESDAILTAIGEYAVLDYLEGRAGALTTPLSPADDLELRLPSPSGAKIFAGGDMIDGPRTVVHAVAAGKKAAISMDCHRLGRDPAEVFSQITIGRGPALSFSKYMGWAPLNPVEQDIGKVVESEHMVYDYFKKMPAVPRAITPLHQRRSAFKPYTATWNEDQAYGEASRCMHCGRCIECDNCLVFCPEVSVHPKGSEGFGYRVDYDYCKGCSICFNECPRGAITMVEEGTQQPEEK